MRRVGVLSQLRASREARQLRSSLAGAASASKGTARPLERYFLIHANNFFKNSFFPSVNVVFRQRLAVFFTTSACVG